MAGITAKQQRFVEEYLIDLNATQAAIRAGYSAKSADKIGPALVGKTRVSEAILQAMAERSRRTGVTAGRVIAELAKIAFVNIADVADLGNATVQEGASRDDTAAILSVKVKSIPSDEGGIVERELKFHDKVRSLELLGRHLGIFNEKLMLDGALQINFSGEGDISD